MAKNQGNAHQFPVQEDAEDYTEIEDFDSDDSEQDPTYIDEDDDLDNTQNALFNFKNLSLKPSARDHGPIEHDDDDGEVSDVEEISAPKLGIKDMKDFEEIQKIIDCGKVEKLKVDQCKVYLRKHGLRLTGKKDILIQRIKEHLEILNGGGEKKYPPSSFVLNCKGDACMGDIVKFDQTVYEGYNIASRSAIGPPCGKRTVAGRIVKESYGAAKQQHTFTVEVLWSKGDKPLPPLHPLLIKGRNLYKLDTMRQKWENEAERQRVLNEKHSRGSIARSNRETRIQEKTLKKTLKKSTRDLPNGQHSRQEKNHRNATDLSDHVSFVSKNQGSKAQELDTVAKNYQQQQTNQYQNLRAAAEYKENLCRGLPVLQPFQQHKTNMPASRPCLAYADHNSSPTLQQSKPIESRLGSHGRIPVNPHSFQQKLPTTSAPWIMSFPDVSHHPQHNFHSLNRMIYHKESQQVCRHYARGNCHYGTRCKFLHVPNRNHC